MTTLVPRPTEQHLPRTRRPLLVVGIAVIALLVAAVLSVAVGAALLTPAQVWAGLTGSGTDQSVAIVRDLRIPRTLLGALVGIALGIAGALMQGHTRNPLADPGLLGVSAGAGFLLVIAIQFVGVTSLYGTVWFAFAGAALASCLVFALASLGGSRSGGPTPVTLALAGVAVSELLIATTSALVLRDTSSLDAYRFWSAGALDDRGSSAALRVAPFVLAGLVLAAANAPALNVLALGEDTARGLGRHVGRARAVGIAAITLLAGSAVAVAGPISFVGLVAPHIARFFTGPDHRWLLPVAGLGGATLVLVADVVGRLVVRPGELQVGIVLAVVGAPFFIALVRRRKLARL
ncbi:iron ABC transporter permease [Actinomycetospora termitidis]|uniref:FecCD family ABC transporter permease n=1 Tax=Actinomycetospora termitidis TaxID=3053470 RepID=UPI0031F2EB3E